MDKLDVSIIIKAVDMLTAPLKKMTGGLGQFGQSLSKLREKMKAISEQAKKLGQDLTLKVTAPIVAVGVSMIKTAADFEQGMANIKAITGATSVEMIKLRALAIQMGATTKYSALEASQGILELEKAGVSTTQIINGGLKGALDLATAGDLELADAAEIASTALNAFRDDNLSVTKAGNIMAGAANVSATSVGELKFSLAMCAAVASSAGMNFMDTNTALALFAQNGLKGSDAGTSLKTMLMNLQPTTKRQIETFGRLNLMSSNGTSIFYDQHGKLKNLASISGILHDKMKSLTPVQRQVAMEAMFGSDAIRASNILYREGAKGADDMAKAMSKVTASQVAAEKMNTFLGIIEKLKGSLETASTSFGSLFVPQLKNVTNVLDAFIGGINSLGADSQKIVAIFAVIAAAVGPLIWAFGALAAVEWAALAPMLGLAAQCVAVAALFAILYVKSAAFRTILQAIGAVLQFVGALILSFGRIVMIAIITPIGWAVKLFGFLGNIAQKIVNVMNKLGAVGWFIKWMTPIGWLVQAFSLLANNMTKVKNIANSLKGGLGWATNGLMNFASGKGDSSKNGKTPVVRSSNAEGAWNLPEDHIAQVHKGEMIIPERYAAAMRAGKGGTGVSLTYSPNISIGAGANINDFKAELKKHAREIVQMVEDAQRNKARTAFA